jgi:myo-inositol-1(or 4)-monophosphatase
VTEPDLGALLGLARAIAVEAGDLLVEHRRGKVAFTTKSTPTDVVTEADTAAEALLVARIRAERPDDGLLGEEGAEISGTSGLRWVVDPLDGTVNYLYDLPAWSVSVAVEDEQGALVGVVHAPALGMTFWAARGGGAYCDGLPVRPSSCTELAQALLGTGFSYDARRRATQARWVAEVLPVVRDIRRYGSAALDLTSGACGRLDAYAEQGLAPWDAAAGALIATEAGAVVGGLGGRGAGAALVVAAAPAIWEPLQQLLMTVHADHDPLATPEEQT